MCIRDRFIDGETITLQFKGVVMVSYNYQAYKNKLLKIYPETTFDLQVVHEGDTFTFSKNSGSVNYKHEFGDPFGAQKTIIGCYCIIKNKRGEFIEILNKEEIQKMRNVAKTQKIWNAWEHEMCLKSVLKRASKRHFNDVVANIELIDNDNYNLENVDLEHEIQELVENCFTVDELNEVYKSYVGKVHNEESFLKLLSDKRKEIQNAD